MAERSDAHRLAHVGERRRRDRAGLFGACREDLLERGGVPAEDVRVAIQSEYGFGPYAAEGILRILGRHDFFAIDSWVRQEYRRRYPGPRRTTDGAIARRYARYGVHRGLALWLDMTSHWHDGGEKA